MPWTTATAKKSTRAPVPHRMIAKSSGDRSHLPAANSEDGAPPWPARAKKKQRLDGLPSAARPDSPTSDLLRADAATAEGRGANSPCIGDNVHARQQDRVKPCSDRINP
jgi:hypothetical protein